MVYSVAGLLGGAAAARASGRSARPTTRSSAAGLVGGGAAPVRPGEISLAHNGVLFLDELLEFPRPVLEALRQPLEERAITVVRARRDVTFPADFMLVAALNPCPCGYLGSALRTCTCSLRRRSPPTGRGCRGRCSTASTCTSRCPRCPTASWRGAAPARPARPCASGSWRRASASSARGTALERPPRRRPSSAAVAALDADGHAPARAGGRRALACRRAPSRGVRRVARTIADLDGSDSVRAPPPRRGAAVPRPRPTDP